MSETLADALEREHREIDGGVEEFLTSGEIEGGAGESLTRALAALRRHIYLEEALLFPPLRAAGLMGPIMVMQREHGAMWQLMDGLDAGADSDVAGAQAVVRELVAKLEAHNPKEEQILYPQADALLEPAAQAKLHTFLASGTLPGGWVCDALRT